MSLIRIRTGAVSLAAAVLVSVSLLPAAAATANPVSTGTDVEVTLPPLPGPHQVGTRTLELIDHGRRDPFAPTPTDRAVVLQAWYPSRDPRAFPPAPYMTAALAAYEEQTAGLPAGTLAAVRTRAHVDPPVLRTGGGWPVVLFSPGSGTSRSLYTTLMEDLASRGFVVLAIDHLYDADAVELPNGQLVLRRQPAETDESNAAAVAVRAADTRFVLDRLAALDSVLDGALDLHRVGMFGHSMGGATTAAAMHDDHRIRAGADLDGTLYGPVVTAGLDRSFLLMSSQYHDRGNDPTWAAFWPQLQGWRRDLKLAGSGHLTYSDFAVLAAPLHLTDLFPPDDVPVLLGDLDGTRAVEIEQTYLTAFFDYALRDRPAPLLAHPDHRYPEVLYEG